MYQQSFTQEYKPTMQTIADAASVPQAPAFGQLESGRCGCVQGASPATAAPGTRTTLEEALAGDSWTAADTTAAAAGS